MPTLLELKTKRNTLITQGRAIHDKAIAEKREMTAEETTNFDKFMDDSDLVKTNEIDPLLAGEARTARLKTAQAEMDARPGRRSEAADPAVDAAIVDKQIFKFPKRSRVGLLSHMGTREIRFNPTAKHTGPLCGEEYRADFRHWLGTGRVSERLEGGSEEMRALQVDIDTAGGYLVTPQQFAAELIAIVDNLVFVRQRATVITLTNATTLGVPSRDVDIADSDWTSELATGSEDSSLAFGKRELMPHPLAKRIKVSNKLLRAGALDVESIVRDRLAYKFGVTQEKAFLLGNGTQQPLGVFVPTTNGSGISTARDIQTGSATNFTADGLIAAKYFLKPQYWPEARWMFHRFGIQRIRQLKDTNGQYLWVPSGIGQANLSEDSNDRILEFGFDVSEYCPNTFTSGLYVGILCAWSHYWIAEALTMQLQRLVELYAEKNQTGYIARAELDGAPVLEEPFVRLITN